MVLFFAQHAALNCCSRGRGGAVDRQRRSDHRLPVGAANGRNDTNYLFAAARTASNTAKVLFRPPPSDSRPRKDAILDRKFWRPRLDDRAAQPDFVAHYKPIELDIPVQPNAGP
jgi:hypothetical protein